MKAEIGKLDILHYIALARTRIPEDEGHENGTRYLILHCTRDQNPTR